MSAGYTVSHQEPGKGAAYDATFSDRGYRNLVWQWERSILDQVIASRHGHEPFKTYLDFACGTGRVLCHLEEKVTDACGVDVSSSMLEIARENSTVAQLVQADLLSGGASELPHAEFDLISSFRFFLNAEPELRHGAMQALAGLLAPDGRMVINNHLNRHSARGVALRLFTKLRHGDADRYATLTHGDIQELLDDAGLEVEEMHRFGVWPVSPTERTRLPLGFVKMIETFAARSSLLSRYATYVIYVVRSKPGQVGSH